MSDSTYYALETMRGIRFGVEVELAGEPSQRNRSGLSTRDAKHVVGQALGGADCRKGVMAPDGRLWQVVNDASIEDCLGFEIVTPICDYDDIPIVQHVLEQLARAGATENELCGVHVHVDGRNFDAPAVTRLVKLCYQQEELILAALGEQAQCRAYEGAYCMPTRSTLISDLAKEPPKTLERLRTMWYPDRGNERRQNKYDDSRYHGVNVHSLFYRGTIEFRWFPTTVSPSRLKTYIQLCLALAAKALNGRHTRARKRASLPIDNERYAMRSLLVRLGLNGDEFKALRRQLLESFEGDIACSKFPGNDRGEARA